MIISSMIDALVDGYEQALDNSRSDAIRPAQRPSVVKINGKSAAPVVSANEPSDHRQRPPVWERISARCWPGANRQTRPTGEMEVLDAAYWVKGSSSLRRHRYAVLLNLDDGLRGTWPAVARRHQGSRSRRGTAWQTRGHPARRWASFAPVIDTTGRAVDNTCAITYSIPGRDAVVTAPSR
ncbi:hypothetical protein [Burkholderia sp. SRS-W-2-2016]|uniref:hypothetical protein n=1 Tax=Burkholderia sp. SRS-W-2-2016 TaxID=1926878 RepID=UPI00117E1982|nr:hypothetical protein [Burkholderia sp. SRS-W-2-2016]